MPCNAFSLAVVLLAGATLASGATHRLLYNFQGGNDGAAPGGALIAGAGGNLYGTTEADGPGCPSGALCGTAFQLSPASTPGGAWTETVIHQFGGPADGGGPLAGMIMDQAGNLYGTTVAGGNQTNCLGGCGMVFELSPPSTPGGAWTESMVHTFNSGADGASPFGGLLMDHIGNLYGTTRFGGGGGCRNGMTTPPGCGTVFQLSPPASPGAAWTETIVHYFDVPGADGLFPLYGSLVLDNTGALYGVTSAGGLFNAVCRMNNVNNGCGLVFKMTPPTTPGGSWSYQILYLFTGGADGRAPQQGLTLDRAGRLYGATNAGGQFGDGTVFRLRPPAVAGGAWSESTLYSFTAQTLPSSLIFDRFGNLYGTVMTCSAGFGSVFKLAPPVPGGSWTETMIYTFAGGSDGAYPAAGVIFGKGGMLLGTTTSGGTAGFGTVFEIVP